MRILLALALVAGCAGDETDPGNGPVCTGAVYDNCNSEHDCMSNDCHTFNAEGYNACTQPCSAATPCPDVNGMTGTCNANGICKPAAAPVCRVVP
jgi:hypothetical protein